MELINIMKKEHYYTVSIIVALILCLTLLFNNSFATRIVTIVTLCYALLGAAALLVQNKRDKDINQASFILEYSKYFYSLSNAEDTLLLLDEYRLGNKDSIKKIEYRGIVNCLIWCEELSSLIQKNVFDFTTIDNVFSYMFFTIVNNEFVQKEELLPQADFYKGIFYLHKQWSDYKKKTNQPIPMEDEGLQKSEIYLSYVSKGNIYNKKSF